MPRRGVVGALDQFLTKLQEGDPVAIGLAGFVVFLAVVAGVIWLVDRNNQKKAAAKRPGPASKSRTNAGRPGSGPNRR